MMTSVCERRRRPLHRAATILALVCLADLTSILGHEPAHAAQPGLQPFLAERADLRTWWHANGELNNATPVADDSVRRSTVYDVKVAIRAAPSTLYDSFAYMSLPRSGSQKKGYTHQDGAEFADQAHLTMSWTSFLYGTSTWVYVHIKEGAPLTSANDVTIRPTTLRFRKERVNERTIRILVPYSTSGYRFSVEFHSQNLTSYHHESGELTTDGSGRPAVHTEPRNGMVIFADPIVTGQDVNRLVPDPARHTIYYPPQGQVSNLSEVTQEVIYFRPGTYHMPWDHHASIRAHWVYLAPGAYVKGAFQFLPREREVKVTGFGVLSGEKYVYEADRANGYKHKNDTLPNCHGTCLKMLEFDAGPASQHLTLHGITVVEPPYHSFAVYGHEHLFRMDAAQFKEVGGWYWQTDGLQLYPGSVLTSSFFHSNDDVLKLYASNIVVSGVVVWKPENGPVVQWGWAPRNIDNVRVSNVDVIHNRMHWRAHNSCIVNSARHYLSPDSDHMAEPDTRVRNVQLENIRSEGMNLCAMRLYALSSWENIHINGLWIEKWNGLDIETQASHFRALSDEHGVQVRIGNEVRDRSGLEIERYVVHGERIRKSGTNWRAENLGRLNFDANLWDNWDAR